MLNEHFTMFTDRREAIALFDLIRSRDNPDKPWPLLPFLAFIGPGGSGKSTLIDYLRAKLCLPDGQPAVPHAALDFSKSEARGTLFSVLIMLRNQLRQQKDERGKQLSFPRFDLGASFAEAFAKDGILPDLKRDEIEGSLRRQQHLFGALGEMGNSFGNIAPIIPPLLVGLKWMEQIPTIKTIIRRLMSGPAWKWYRAELELAAITPIERVLERLHSMSMPGGGERDRFLIERLLPSALAADLCAALAGPSAPQAWSKTTGVVLFLDGFEELPKATGHRLLEALACNERRKRGETDPLLLVIASRDRVLDNTDAEQNPSFELLTSIEDVQAAEQYVRVQYQQWSGQLRPESKRYGLRLSELYLPLWMQDFGPEHTRLFLERLGEHWQQQVFAGSGIEKKTLVAMIQLVTHGQPLYLALAASAALEAEMRGQHLAPYQFEQALVSTEVIKELGHQDERIGDYLLALFLEQLSNEEREQFIFCAAPRLLSLAILKVILQLSDEDKADEWWNHYRRHTFLRIDNKGQLLLHPIVRDMLLRRLPPRPTPESRYQRVHTRLRDYFYQVASKGDQQARIEEVYHALALGDPEPAIMLGFVAQRGNPTLWEPLLEAVAQAPTGLLPADTEARASDALNMAEQHHGLEECVMAVVLYIWLLTASREDTQKAAVIHHNLGVAYYELPSGDRQTNLERAITNFQAALQIFTREAFPNPWAMTQNNLGNVYRGLLSGNRAANLERAIACYREALHVYTREEYPLEWAMTQLNLGTVYNDLTGRDRANLERAIACYQEALHVYTHEEYPLEWAGTQFNLGNAYRDLTTGDLAANLENAIKCYRAALQVYTREVFPGQWAMTQNNLNDAFSRRRSLPSGP